MNNTRMDGSKNFDLNFDNVPNCQGNLCDTLNENIDEIHQENHPSSAMRLHTLCIFYPQPIVRVVEDNGGWQEPLLDNLEGEAQMNPRNISELGRLIKCLKDIHLRTWTDDVQYVMLNLLGYKELLESVLIDMKLCRELRSSPTLTRRLPTSSQSAVLPVINRNDLRRHAVGVQALLDDLERVQARDGYPALMLLDEFDQHIDTFQQLIQFLQ